MALAHAALSPLLYLAGLVTLAMARSAQFPAPSEPLFRFDTLLGQFPIIAQPVFATLFGGVLALGAALAWAVYRVVAQRQPRPFAHFALLWRRSASLGLVIAVWVGLLASLPGQTVLTYVSWPLFLLICAGGPAALARCERRRGRISKWRPACPECGHVIRRDIEPRCSECGGAFPTASRVYRRWAVRRLAWDSLENRGWISAYVRTLFMVLFRPGAAGRRVVIPDRWRRAFIWVAVHLFALAPMAFVAPLLWYTAESILRGEALEFRSNTGEAPEHVDLGRARSRRHGWILAQRYFAYALTGTAFIVPAILILQGHPRMSALRRASLMKWTLYSIAVPMWLCALIAVSYQAVRNSIWDAHVPHFAALLSTAWWSTGVAANVYGDRPRLGVFTGCLAAYLALWCALILWILPPGVLWNF